MNSKTSSKKNVLVLASTFPRFKGDSVPEFVLDFARNLNKIHSVTVLAPYDVKAKFRDNIDGVEIYRFPYFIPGLQRLTYRGGLFSAFRESTLAKIQLPFFLLTEFIFASYIILKKRINLINAHWLFPQGIVAVVLKTLFKKDLIITTHGGDVAILDIKKVNRLFWLFLIHADVITFVSKYTFNKFKKVYPEFKEEKLKIMPMGIYLPEKVKANDFAGNVKLLFIGRLVEIKGVNYLLEAVGKLVKADYKITLDILGDGPERKNLENLVKKLKISKNVNFRGYTTGKEKNRYLVSTNIVIVPSIIDKNKHEEGLPVSALEALSYGKVLIATNTGGLRYLINDKNGLLIIHSDSNEIRNAIENIIKNKKLRNDISREAIITSENYSWKNIIDTFVKLIK